MTLTLCWTTHCPAKPPLLPLPLYWSFLQHTRWCYLLSHITQLPPCPSPSILLPTHGASHQHLLHVLPARNSRAFQQPSVQERVIPRPNLQWERIREETHTWLGVLQNPSNLLPRRIIVQYLCSILTLMFWNIQVSSPITRINNYAVLKDFSWTLMSAFI